MVTCAADGVSTERVDECAASERCDDGKCIPCYPEVTFCEGMQPKVCSADGSGSSPLGSACAEGQGCTAGVCVGEGYARWPLPGTPGHPVSYTVNAAAGTVLDQVTGLLWQREPAPDTYSWLAARRYCEALKLGGRRDWRQPTRMELLSIVDFTRQSPAINTDVFVAEVDSPVSSEATRGNETWYLSSWQGNGYTTSLEQEREVRCVAEARPQLPVPVSGHFFEATEHTVTDTATRLEWQRVRTGEHDQAGAMAHCAALSLDGKRDWRLPTILELASLVQFSKEEVPRIHEDLFSVNMWVFHWSATPEAGGDGGWAMSVYGGWHQPWVVTGLGAAGCVRSLP